MTMDHTWAKIEHNGQPLWVSLDAIKVDGVRVPFTPDELRAAAKELGGRLITCREMDARWLASGLHNLPHPNQAWFSAGGSKAHSEAVDGDLVSYDDEHGEPYLWILGNVGKPWVASQNDDPEIEGRYIMSNGCDPLYQWAYDEHTKGSAAGIPLHNPETPELIGRMWVIQQPWNSSHKHHSDYSSTGVIATNDEPDEYVMIGPDGMVVTVRALSQPPPTPITRRSTPMAMRVADLIPPPPSLPPDMAPDTEPSPPPWLDPDLTHGERKVVWLEAQRAAGVCERPDGSNNGPEISTYHAATLRDGVPNFGPWLAKAGGNWCASFAWAAHMRTYLEGIDIGVLGTPRSSGLETENDAKKDGTWRPAELAITGKFKPEPGDIGTIQRGKPGSWRRHVFTIVRDEPARQGCWTSGGNEGNRVGADKFRKYSSLLGFREIGIAGEAARYQGEIPYQGEDVEVVLPEDEVIAATTDGDNALAYDGWDHMDPDPWQAENPHGVVGHSRRWWVDHRGIYVVGESVERRTKGRPLTVGAIMLEHHDAIEEAALLTGVPVETILATVATESRGDVKADRYEPGHRDSSFGLMQTLTETAWAIARQLNVTAPRKPLPRGGDVAEWRAFLFEPRNSILIGAAYIAYNDERFKLLGDPILAAAAYNAGSPRVKLANPWGVVCTSAPTYDHCDVFSKWYGDALAVVA